MAKNNAHLYDVGVMIQAGIDPKTKMPTKFASGTPEALRSDIRHAIRIIDEQDAIGRYTWYNLPDGIDGQMLERMLYYKGQLCFFYFEEIGQFLFTPYTLDSSNGSPLDFYGRFKGIKPIPWFNVSEESAKEEKVEHARQQTLLSSKHLKPLYDVVLLEDWLKNPDLVKTSCVLLKDYTEQISQTITPRATINDPIVNVEAECIPFMRTALMRATGVKGMRVGTQDEQANVEAANRAMYDAALTGKVNIPIVATADFQELNNGQVGKAEEFMMALQSLDNFRLSTYGLDNGGLFQKRERKLVAEQEMNAGGGSIGLVLQDGLTRRQRFCDIVNSVWGLNIAVDISETVSGTDKNLDGELSDQQDQSGIGEGQQPAGGVEENV